MWLYLPLRLLSSRYKTLSIVKFPISSDTLPSKELSYKDKYVNSLHLNRLLGILPAMRLLVLKSVFYKWRYIEDWERYGTLSKDFQLLYEFSLGNHCCTKTRFTIQKQGLKFCEGTKPWWGFPPLKLLPKFKYFSQCKLANSMDKGPWKLLWQMSYYFIYEICN